MEETGLRKEEAGFAYDSVASPGSSVPPPPAYCAENPSDPFDLPPSYESLFGRVKTARVESSGTADFFKRLIVLLLGTIGFTICLAFILALPVAMVAIGAYYLNDCKVERFIPIYLIVGGCFGIVKNLSNLGQRLKNKSDDDADEKNAKSNPFDMLLNCFLLAWFIAGNVWIYGIYNEWSSNPISANYCHPTLYYFAFWITTATYILMGTVCCCVCCGGIVTAMVTKE